MAKSALRRNLSAPGLLKIIKRSFSQIKDPKAHCEISLTDCLMSGLAIFGLKYPSLLQFDQASKTTPILSNLKSLYGIQHVPSGT